MPAKRRRSRRKLAPRGTSEKTRIVSRGPSKRKFRADRQAVQDVCALINPFCDASVGVKMPVMGTSRTLTYQVRTPFDVALSGSTGRGACLVYPGLLKSAIYNAPTLPASVVTNWGTALDVNGYAELDLDFKNYRVVSAGIRITNVSAPLTTSGYLNVCFDERELPLGVSMSTTNSEFNHQAALTGLDLASAARIVDGVVAVEMSPITNFANDESGWGCYTIFMVGGELSAKDYLRVELVQNIELQADAGSFLSRTQTPTRPINYPLQNVVEHTLVPAPIVEKYDVFDGSILRHASHAIENAGSQLLGAAIDGLLGAAANAVRGSLSQIGARGQGYGAGATGMLRIGN